MSETDSEPPKVDAAKEADSPGVIERISDTHRIILIDAPPRSGKTHGGLEYCLTHGLSFVSITNSHAVCGHQIDTIKWIVKNEGIDTPVVVHIVGMSRACVEDDGDCSSCPRRELTYAIYSSMSEEERLQHPILTVDTITQNYPDVCPYHFLKAAMEDAVGIVTVPHFFSKIPPKDILFIDEETVLRYFSPASCKLISLKQRRGRVQYGESPLNEISQVLRPIADYILANGKRSHRERDQVIVTAIDKLLELNNSLKISAEAGSNPSVELSRWSEIMGKLSAVEIPDNIDQDDLFGAIYEYSYKILHPDKEEHPNLAPFLQAVIWNAGYYFQKQKGSGVTEVLLIGDKERRFYLDRFAQYGKVMIAGGKEAELFVDALVKHSGWNHDCVQTIRIETFPFVDRFIVLPIKGKLLDEQRKKTIQMAKKCNAKGLASLLLCGSKKQAEHVRSHQLDRFRIITDKKDGIEELRKYAIIGLTTIFYQNSKISRGVDTPFVSMMFIYGAGFSQPYYEWLSKLKNGDIKGMSPGEIEEKVAFGKEMLDYTKTMETTNSVLRISPTLREDLGDLKVIVVPEKYVRYIRYLTSRTTKHSDAIWHYIIETAVKTSSNIGFLDITPGDMENSQYNGRKDAKLKGNILYIPLKRHERPETGLATRPDTLNTEKARIRASKQTLSLDELEATALYFSLPQIITLFCPFFLNNIRKYLHENGPVRASDFIETLKKFFSYKGEADLKKFIHYLLITGEISKERRGRTILYEVIE